jgi:putative membrane protein
MKAQSFFIAVTSLTLYATGFAADKDAKPSPSPEAINTSPGTETAVPAAQADKHGKDANHPGQRAPITATEFAAMAAMGGMMEVEMGKVAEEKGGSEDVKSFGALMIKDHSAANAKLIAIAKAKDIKLPDKLDAKHQAMVDKMAKMSGAAFDKMYVRDMVTDHKKDVAFFKNAKENVTDTELKSFATNTLPIIQGHLEKITAIQASMK